MVKNWPIFLFILSFVAIILFQPFLLAQDSLVTQLTQVQQYIEQGNLSMASYLLEKVESQAPDPLMPYIEAVAGNLSLQQGNYHQAIVFYDKLYQEGFGGQKTNRLALLNNYFQALVKREQTYENLAKDDLALRPELLNLAQSDRSLAQKMALEAANLAAKEVLDASEEVRSQLNLMSLEGDRVDLSVLEGEIEALPPSENQVRFYLNLAKISAEPFPLLEKSLSLAQAVGSSKSLSLAWGNLGLYYEQQGEFLQVLNASHRAAWAAQEAFDWVRLATWQWLSARTYRQMGNADRALAAYRNATESIKQLRRELAGSPVSQSLYFDTIEPLLRDFLGFLLSQSPPSDESLKEAITLLRLNQLAELDNYFGDICQVSLEVNPSRPADTLTIYTVLLPQQAYEILEFAEGDYRLVKLSLSGEALKQQVFEWRQQLTDQFHQYYLEESSRLYQIAIAPIEEQLQSISHLVFVQDGIWRTVPMAALYDSQREQFLLEKYAISYSLGGGGKLEAAPPKEPLIVASSQPSPAFPNPIPGVIEEAAEIEALLGGTRLLNEAFSPQALAEQLEQNQYELLHLASHSRFTGLVEEALVQTGTGTLSLIEFERLLRSRQNSLTHLTLSACETAEGSRYAVLGLAGIGIRSGIGSVLGSLWFASDDETVSLVINFYQFWKNGNTPEESLRKAQILQIQSTLGSAPAVWGAFILLKS